MNPSGRTIQLQNGGKREFMGERDKGLGELVYIIAAKIQTEYVLSSFSPCFPG